MKSFLIRNYLLIIILAIAAILRFWHLTTNPPSLFVDEVSNGYNAYSILKTGKDEYGNRFPLTFRAFGDYNLALSAYTLVPSIAVFGLNEFGVRFPSALVGTLTVLTTYFLVKKLFPKWKMENVEDHEQSRRGRWKIDLAQLSAFFLAIAPWHIQFSRYDHEANFMLFASVLGITLFLYSFNNFKNLILSAISFGLALNTYQGAKIWIPLFLLSICFWYRKELLKLGMKLIIPVAIFALFTLPILLNFKNNLIRGQSVGILNGKDPPETFITGYLSHYAPNFLFTAGDNIPRHSVLGMGQLYIFELPLILTGLVVLAKQKTRESKFLFTWLLIAAIPAAIATPTPHALRAISFLPLWSIIGALGAVAIVTKINKNYRAPVIFLILIIGIYNVITYLHLYYVHDPKIKFPDWSYGYKQMVQYVNQNKEKYDTIAISTYFGHPYIFTLFYSKYDPAKYQPQSEDKTHFDKFEFFGSSWGKMRPGKALLVRPQWQIPNSPTNVVKVIKSQTGDAVFILTEE